MKASFRVAAVMAAGLLLGGREWKAPNSPVDEAAVRATVQAYFDGLVKFDRALLSRAFDSSAAVMSARPDRGLRSIPFPEWVRFTEGTPPAAAEVPRYVNRILAVDIAGNAASVKTDLEWPGVHYVDYLALLKIGNDWKIVNKIWWAERR